MTVSHSEWDARDTPKKLVVESKEIMKDKYGEVYIEYKGKIRQEKKQI